MCTHRKNFNQNVDICWTVHKECGFLIAFKCELKQILHLNFLQEIKSKLLLSLTGHVSKMLNICFVDVSLDIHVQSIIIAYSVMHYLLTLLLSHRKNGTWTWDRLEHTLSIFCESYAEPPPPI